DLSDERDAYAIAWKGYQCFSSAQKKGERNAELGAATSRQPFVTRITLDRADDESAHKDAARGRDNRRTCAIELTRLELEEAGARDRDALIQRLNRAADFGAHDGGDFDDERVAVNVDQAAVEHARVRYAEDRLDLVGG